MSTPTPLSSSAMDLRRRSRRWVLWMGLSMLLCLPPYLGFAPLWARVVTLNGGAFVLAAAGFGLLLVIGPLGVICSLLAAIFTRVEAVTQAGERPRGAGDFLALSGGLLFSFAPALAIFGLALRAILTGEVRYKFPAAMVQKAIDPLGYWQGVGFWLMGATALAILAGVYWRSRWRRRLRTA